MRRTTARHAVTLATTAAAAVASLALLVLAGCAATPPAPDAPALIRQAEQALGSADVRTLVVTAQGGGATFGQAYRPDQPWPALRYSTLTRTLDFANGAFREDFARSRAEPTGGGAVPLLGQGEARASGFSRDGFAWNGAPGGGAMPAPVSLQQREHDLWTTTPHGALKAAARHGAVAGTRVDADGRTVHTLAYTAPGQYAATLVLDPATAVVTRIESTVPNPVLGDTPVVTRFSDYRPVAGSAVRFPMRIEQSQGGFPVYDLAVADVKVDVASGIAVPDAVRNARENVAVEKLADGVWFLGGGSHNSVAVELSNQIVLVESPLHDGRAQVVFAAANMLVPGKKVLTVIDSHHHFDHAGGLRFAVAEGAELITSEIAKPYFERVFANPNRIAPDRLAQSGGARAPRITGVAGATVLRDALRPVEVHFIEGSPHAQGFMMVWLPKERILVEADAYTPGAPGTPPPATPNGLQVNLVENIERLKLPVDRIAPLHGRMTTMAELYAQIGRGPR